MLICLLDMCAVWIEVNADSHIDAEGLPMYREYWDVETVLLSF